jgi:transcriptional regulator with XRE-family HTH domain
MDWESVAGELLRDSRVKAGLSQREVSKRSGIAQSHIARIERGSLQPSIPTLGKLLDAIDVGISFVVHSVDHRTSASAASARISDALQEYGEERALREWLVLLDDLSAVDAGRFSELVAEAPRLIGDRRWDALVAATVEYVADLKCVAPARWVEEEGRHCHEWYFSGIRALEDMERAESPVAFVRHGVYLSRLDLDRV